MIAGLWQAIMRELRSLHHPGPRMIDEFECMVSVPLAIAFAHALGAQNVGWAAFSGYAVMRPRLSDSLTRGTLRIAGTAAGAGVILLAIVVLEPILLLGQVLFRKSAPPERDPATQTDTRE